MGLKPRQEAGSVAVNDPKTNCGRRREALSGITQLRQRLMLVQCYKSLADIGHVYKLLKSDIQSRRTTD